MPTPKSSSPVPTNLRRLRLAAGLTQEQLAEAADVTDATISRIERGRFSPSHDLLERLAQGLGVDPSDLVRKGGGTKQPSVRRSEARLLALVRHLDDPQVDDVAKALKTLLAVGKRMP